MPRTMDVGSTGVVRALVDRLDTGDEYRPECRVITVAYGPYADSTSCRDMMPNGRPTRVQKQKLIHSYSEGGKLIWSTVKTTYTNGGEEVDWDEGAGV